jgi:hypothetical protein
MAVTAANTTGKGWLSIDFTGVAATTGGAIASVKNPEGVDVVVTNAFVYIATNSTGAANLTIGTGTSATTDYSNMVTATAMAAAAGKVYTAAAISASIATEVTAPGVWLSTQYINITGSASTAGLTGTLFVEYVRTA